MAGYIPPALSDRIIVLGRSRSIRFAIGRQVFT